MGNKFGWHSGTATARNIKVENQLSVRGSLVVGTLPMVKGDIWYLDGNVSVSGDGKSWSTAVKTAAEAFAHAGDYDAILVAPAVYTLTSKITITQMALKVIGSASTGAHQPCTFKMVAGTDDMILIKADRVEIANLCLSNRVAYGTIVIGDTAGQAYYQTHIHDCSFDGYSTGTYGITPGPISGLGAENTVTDTVNLVVENCFFKSYVTVAVVSDGTRDCYRNNVFDVLGDSAGIYVLKTGGNRDYGVISDNLFMGRAGTTTIGIKGAGNNTLGTLIYANNLFVGDFDTTINNNTGNPGVQNFQGSTTGGSLIDCNSSA